MEPTERKSTYNYLSSNHNAAWGTFPPSSSAFFARSSSFLFVSAASFCMASNFLRSLSARPLSTSSLAACKMGPAPSSLRRLATSMPSFSAASIADSAKSPATIAENVLNERRRFDEDDEDEEEDDEDEDVMSLLADSDSLFPLFSSKMADRSTERDVMMASEPSRLKTPPSNVSTMSSLRSVDTATGAEQPPSSTLRRARSATTRYTVDS